MGQRRRYKSSSDKAGVQATQLKRYPIFFVRISEEKKLQNSDSSREANNYTRAGQKSENAERTLRKQTEPWVEAVFGLDIQVECKE